MHKVIFIGGMGRSGTHYLGRILGEHPEVKLRLESRFTFWPITNHVAYNEKASKVRFWVATTYLKILASFSPKLVCEKTHPSIWVKHKLDLMFPNAKWVCVIRDPYQAIASMKRHKGVQKWYQRVPQDSVNPFLGINHENRKQFKYLSLVEKGAFKWLSHINKMEEIQRKSPGRVILVNFDDLVNDQKTTLGRVFRFLNLPPITPDEKGELSTLNKKGALSKEEALAISEILKVGSREEWIEFSPYVN